MDQRTGVAGLTTNMSRAKVGVTAVSADQLAARIGPPKPYVHYSSPGAVQAIAATRQLWGKGTGRVPLGGLSARAYDGPHIPAKIHPGSMHGVDFTTKMQPLRWAPSVGGRVWLWHDGLLGTNTVTLPCRDDVVIVDIDVIGVAP